MSKLTEQVEFCRAGGEVSRYHTVRTLRQQLVSEHSFGVAYLCALIYGPKEVSAALLVHALFHDLPEQTTGDVPAPVKRRIGVREAFTIEEYRVLGEVGLELPGLTEEEKLILKAADSMEGMANCVREAQFGNTQLAVVFANFASYVREVLPEGGSPEGSQVFGRAWEIYDWLQGEWELSGGGA